jgi:hypothetical protein
MKTVDRGRICCFFNIMLVFATLVAPSGAQTIRGALTGVVTDSTGAVVPGVTAYGRPPGPSVIRSVS